MRCGINSESLDADASGNYYHAFKTPLDQPGDYQLVAYVLGGSVAAEAESPTLKFAVH